MPNELVPLDSIEWGGGTQSRAAIYQETVDDYKDALEMGAQFPAIVVFKDKHGKIWPGDGFHRGAARRAAGDTDIECDVRAGDRKDALLFSVGCNDTHGLRRRTEDKRASILALLNEKEWENRSDRWVAEACKVSAHFVSSVRATAPARSSNGRVGKDGKKRKQPERQAGDDTEAEKDAKASDKLNGQVAFSLKSFYEYLGRAGAELDKLCHEHGLVNRAGVPACVEHAGLIRKLNECAKECEAWHKALKKKE